ncbi:atp-dependent RNA helicase ddx56-related [Anaeramoeba flamelloides]|uniref:RNA helicase n=1 Tax=Anaeramoeba flamelloides TaxID=1746091 RepID=A0AAV8A0Y0_9EUKA|nr:atp-dependent RNA helicase ddx56-related [Anaeramoeba flamelloides]
MTEETTPITFETSGMDNRLVSACNRLGWKFPTAIQQLSLPGGLAGKDLLIRSRTGSGKSASYLLPILNRLLKTKVSQRKSSQIINNQFHPFGIILVPTRELCEQVEKQIEELSYFCKNLVFALHIIADIPIQTQKTRLISQIPDIVISTPTRLALLMKQKIIVLKENLQVCAIDEADLIFTFGYSEDLNHIVTHMNRICQFYLVSATLSTEIEEMEKLVLQNPLICNIKETESNKLLTQMAIKVTEDDKFLLLYVLLRLGQLQTKALIFVNDLNKSYRLKLFLERFSISSVVLNNELPQNTRNSILENFNRGNFDIMIAIDENIEKKNKIIKSLGGDEKKKDNKKNKKKKKSKKEKEKNNKNDGDSDGEEDNNLTNEKQNEELDEKFLKQKQKKKKDQELIQNTKKDEEFGVVRGFDFKKIKTVVNFDIPKETTSYIHRIGRTSRAGEVGTVLTFYTLDEQDTMIEINKKVQKEFQQKTMQIVPNNNSIIYLPFPEKKVSTFRYRINNVLNSITKNLVKDARIKEIKREIINSKKLQSHFKKAPNDLIALRHDLHLQPNQINKNLTFLPNYLFQNQKVPEGVHERKRKKKNRKKKNTHKKRRRNNPLKSFRVD